MSTPAAEAMADVVASIAPTLKSRSFRKRRHTFNRTAEPGLVHVVNFQMGPHSPPGSEDIPGLRESKYGQFTINLGVFVSEMVIEEKLRPKRWVNEYNCQLRKRIGSLLTGRDVWWPLDDAEEAAAVADDSLRVVGLPWLDRFTSRDSVVCAFKTEGWMSIGLPPNGGLLVGWMLKDSDRAHAEMILREYLAEEHHEGHLRWLEPKLQAAGLAHLLSD